MAYPMSVKWKIFYWFVDRRWVLIGLSVILLITYEVNEPYFQLLLIPVHITEYILYTLFMVAIGVLIELLLRASRNQNSTLKILDHKHQLSQELSQIDDWDALTDRIARFPGTIVAVEQSCLFVRNPISGQFTQAASWPYTTNGTDEFCAVETCAKCQAQTRDGDFIFGRCHYASQDKSPDFQPTEYCIPIKLGQGLLAVLRIKMKPGEALSIEQKEIFRNIGDELALALKLGQDRKTIADIHSAETALAERRTVSHFLHDSLGQNLAYLHLKLDQLANESGPGLPDTARLDLERMREAASQSYEIVRSKLEAIQPETMPVLNNLLNEHARKIAQRAHLTISIKNKGIPVSLLTDVQRTVFYVFQEVISNIEKHAGASKVEVLLDWQDNALSMLISDDGIGFDPQLIQTDKHFGLQIVRERLTKVNGRIDLISAYNSGTTVSICIPFSPQTVCEAVHEAP